MSASGWVHIEVEKILAETDKALLCRLAEYEDDIWIPLSQIADSGDYRKGDVDVTISVTEWFADIRGI